MGKLATTGLLVTRDNEASSVWLLEREPSDYSGRDLVPVSIVENRTVHEAKDSVDRGCRRSLPGSKQLSLLVGIVAALVVAATCGEAATAVAPTVPMLSRANPYSPTGSKHDLEDVYDEAFREEDRLSSSTRTVLNETELDIIRRSIVLGLGLERIPDPSKANVSQAEYERAHREYLTRTQQSLNQQTFGDRKKLHVFPAAAYSGNETSYHHWLFFPVEIPEENEDASRSVDHATLRLLLHGATTGDDDGGNNYSELSVLLYLKTSTRTRKLIDRRKIESQYARHARWLELDATLAASSWLNSEESPENFGLELEFLLNGESVGRAFSSPVLNVFASTSSQRRTKRSSPPQEFMPLHKGRRTKCKGESKKCCRHELTVMFKELKGFEFIVYPKSFDAGFCKGRCPPRYNPAHHHALLQSLLWKEDRKKVPKPCCAPSKLEQLMIVYFDENDSTQLKVSFWKNIQVTECACS